MTKIRSLKISNVKKSPVSGILEIWQTNCQFFKINSVFSSSKNASLVYVQPGKLLY